MRLDTQELVERSRDIALVLRRMSEGDLAGMFDEPTTVQVHPACPLVVIDLSAVYQANRDALPLVLACATSWLQNAIAATPGTRRFVVVDEAWALLSHLGTAQWLQQSFKLSRAHGVANIAVLHRLSDLTAAGDAGSQAVSLAHGLLADTGTRVIYTQPTSELRTSRDQLGLSTTESGAAAPAAAGRRAVEGRHPLVSGRAPPLQRRDRPVRHRRRDDRPGHDAASRRAR